MRQLRATGERNRLRIAEPPQQSRRVFLRLKSPPEGGIWGGVRLVNDANGGDNTIGSKPTERKINKLHKRMNNKYSLPKDGGLISESAPRDIIHRYEKIHTKVYENEYEGVQYVADNIVKAIRMYNEIHCSNEVYEESQPFVLGLTTGRTPLGLYRELVKRHHEGQISFRNVAVYSLDEFYPIRSTEQQSRNYRIHEEFLNHIDILPENVHIPDGTVPEDRVSEYCASYDHSVRRIDLMIIGVGEDGQIGFNEPGSYSRSRTRLVQLTYNTRKIQSGAFFGLENTPKMAVTMGIDTIMRANRIILMAWGEEKAHIVQRVVEGEITDQVPASYLQAHQNIEVVIDENAAQLLTREQTPWMVGPCEWTPKFVRKAVVWLCGVVKKPILKLTYKDYIENSLGELLEQGRAYDQINIDVFNDLQHTITGWPGGKPNADDSTRPVPSKPFPKKVLIFSPHPDDDVISMGGTFIRLVDHGHDVHVAYETSGDFAVNDDVVLQQLDTVRELGFADRFDEVKRLIAGKVKGQPEPRELLDIKAAIRRAEAKAVARPFPEPTFLRNGRIEEGAAFAARHRYHRQAVARDRTRPDLCRRRSGRSARYAPHLHGGRARRPRSREGRRVAEGVPPVALPRRLDGVGPRHGGHGRAPVARRADYETPRHLPPPLAEGHHALPGQRSPRVLAAGRGAHAEHRKALRPARHGRIPGYRGVCEDVLAHLHKNFD